MIPTGTIPSGMTFTLPSGQASILDIMALEDITDIPITAITGILSTMIIMDSIPPITDPLTTVDITAMAITHTTGMEDTDITVMPPPGVRTMDND